MESPPHPMTKGSPMDESLGQTVRRLPAIAEIRQLKARYFRAVDLKLWDESAGLVTPDLQIDFAESTSKPMTRDIWPMSDLAETPRDSAYESHSGYGHHTEECRKANGARKISRTRLTRLKRVILDSGSTS
jgi:hypothetical protein